MEGRKKNAPLPTKELDQLREFPHLPDQVRATCDVRLMKFIYTLLSLYVPPMTPATLLPDRQCKGPSIGVDIVYEEMHGLSKARLSAVVSDADPSRAGFPSSQNLRNLGARR